MILPLDRSVQADNWAAVRANMIRETESFLEEGLRHPERHRRIPAIPVGGASFARGFADLFWSQVLATS